MKLVHHDKSIRYCLYFMYDHCVLFEYDNNSRKTKLRFQDHFESNDQNSDVSKRDMWVLLSCSKIGDIIQSERLNSKAPHHVFLGGKDCLPFFSRAQETYTTPRYITKAHVDSMLAQNDDVDQKDLFKSHHKRSVMFASQTVATKANGYPVPHITQVEAQRFEIEIIRFFTRKDIIFKLYGPLAMGQYTTHFSWKPFLIETAHYNSMMDGVYFETLAQEDYAWIAIIGGVVCDGGFFSYQHRYEKYSVQSHNRLARLLSLYPQMPIFRVMYDALSTSKNQLVRKHRQWYTYKGYSVLSHYEKRTSILLFDSAFLAQAVRLHCSSDITHS